MKSRLIPFILFCLIVIFLGLGLRLDPRSVPSPLIGKAAPDFNLPTLDNPAVMVNKQSLLGKIYLLNVWASWCVSCRQEHLLLVNLGRSNLIEIYGLNYKDQPADAQRWLINFGNPYRLTLVDADGRAGIDYGVYGVPESYVIDKHGVIRYKYIGPLTSELINNHLIPLVNALKTES